MDAPEEVLNAWQPGLLVGGCCRTGGWPAAARTSGSLLECLGQSLIPRSLHGDRVSTLAELPDERLASAGRGGQIKLWLVDESKLIAALCRGAGRNLSADDWARYIGADTPRQPSCNAFGLLSNWR
jgi:hypothetical protein